MVSELQNNTLQVRSVADEDRQCLLPILREAMSCAHSYPYDPMSNDEELLKIWLAPTHRVYIGLIESRIAGTFYIRPNQPCLGAHICNAGFIVSSNFSGRGVGTTLGKYALKQAKKLGYKAMQFNLVVVSNVVSIRIWKNLGFRVIGTIPEAFNHPQKGLIDAHIMHKKL